MSGVCVFRSDSRGACLFGRGCQGAIVKKRVSVSWIVVCVLAVIWLAAERYTSIGSSPQTDGRAISPTDLHGAEGNQSMGKVRVKEREVVKNHRPEQLVRFILPDVEIDGLGLKPALAKVMEAYVDTCNKSGERPLLFTFQVPEDDDVRLHMKLSQKNFNAAVRILAAAAGMKVTRRELEYVFEKIPDTMAAGKKVMTVAPDLREKVTRLAGMSDDEAEGMSLEAMIRRLGVSLDSDTKLTRTPGGELVIDSTSSADLAKLDALLGPLAAEMPTQIKFSTKLLEIPESLFAEMMALDHLSDAQLQLTMRKLAMTGGVDLMTLPEVTTWSGGETPARIEMIREVAVPRQADVSQSDLQMVGKVVDVNGSAFGFGQQFGLSYTDTELDEATGDDVVWEKTRIDLGGFAEDGQTRTSFQKLPNGRVVMLLATGQLVDATGVPLRAP